MCLFLADPFPPAGRMEEKMMWTPLFFTCTTRSSLILACSVICAHLKEEQWIVVCVLDKLWHCLSNILDLSSWKAADLLWLPVRVAAGHLSSLNRASPAMSTHHFFLWYPLCASGTVSPYRPCLWLSIAVKASNLVLVVMLEGGEWSPAFWVTRVHSSYYGSTVLKLPI